MILPVVAAVGDRIERAWSNADYDTDAFPRLCVDYLSSAALDRELSPDAVIDWVFQGDLPRQADPEADFGQPPVTLYRARRFYISALFWVDGTTAIHDHGFSGAFQVLLGSSIETTFTFDERRDVGGQLRFGKLTVEKSRLLRQGDIQPIVAGPRFIHSLFHLPRPTISLVVRTISDAKPGVQLNYLPPGIGHNSFHVDETLQRMIQLVDLHRILDRTDLENRVGDVIARSDPHSAFAILMACAKLPDRALVGRLVERVRDREARQLFADWITAAERIRYLQSKRAMVHDSDLRFLLAVLLNAQRRADAFALVAAHVPDVPPARQIARWLAGLSTVTARLQVAGSSWEPNLLGLPALTARLEAVLAADLAGENPGAPAGPEGLAQDEAAFLAKLRGMPMLQPLFR